jgi:acetylglutamate synthase
LGFQVNSIDHDRLTAYLERGKIPIWDGVAVTTDGAEIPLNGDVTTVELAHLLQPFRIIFACNDGGILDKDNKAIPVVYMDKDYEDLMSASWVSQRRKIQLLQLRRIVSVVPSSCTVVVTAIDSVTHQLMYPRLANETIVKRAEENIVHVIEDVNMVDKEELRQLIEDSFGRPLAADYLDNLNTNLYRIYLITGMDGEYNGCAVIMHGVKWETTTDTDSEASHNPDTPPGDSDSDHSPDPCGLDSHVSDPLVSDPHVSDPHVSDPHVSDTHISDPHVSDPHVSDPHGSDHGTDRTHPTASIATECSDASSTSTAEEECYKFYYLCKFCVRKSAQGLGLGDLLWRSLQRDIDRLYWRSRTNNPLNAWYYARCQGAFRTNSHFTIFWYGDDKFEDGASLINDALSKPVTILPVPT